MKLNELREAIKSIDEVTHLSWPNTKAGSIKDGNGGPTAVPHRVYVKVDEYSQQVLDFMIGWTTDSASILIRDPQSTIVAGMLREKLGVKKETPRIIS